MGSTAQSKFISRELSWLEFNQRVLDEALDASNPLLERVKFFCIVSSNLDEFFEVRVAGIKQQIESDIVGRSIDGLTATFGREGPWALIDFLRAYRLPTPGQKTEVQFIVNTLPRPDAPGSPRTPAPGSPRIAAPAV